MSKQCSICGKKSIMAGKRKKLMSRYNPLPQKRKYPNLQWMRLASGKKVKACANCLKAIGKRK